MEDVQRRIAEQVRELHLDERLAQGREALGRNIAFGREKAGTVLNRLYADVEAFREAQRRRAEEAAAASPGEDQPLSPASSSAGLDLGRAQQAVGSVGARAGAYVSSWAAWAGEKRKGGGWGMWGRPKKDELLAGDGSGAGGYRDGRHSGEVLETFEVRDGGFVAVGRTSAEGRSSTGGTTAESEKAGDQGAASSGGKAGSEEKPRPDEDSGPEKKVEG